MYQTGILTQKYGFLLMAHSEKVHKKSYRSFARSDSNIILAMDETDRLMRRIKAQNAPMENFMEEAEIMKASTQALEDHKSGVADNVDEKKLALRMKSLSSSVEEPKTTEDPTQ